MDRFALYKTSGSNLYLKDEVTWERRVLLRYKISFTCWAFHNELESKADRMDDHNIVFFENYVKKIH